MHDKPSRHISSITKTWLNTNNIRLMTSPSCSPVLNAIEKLRGISVQSAYKNKKQYGSLIELKITIEQTWNDIDESKNHAPTNFVCNMSIAVLQEIERTTKY